MQDLVLNKRCTRFGIEGDKKCQNPLTDEFGYLLLSEFSKSGKSLDTLCKNCRKRDRQFINRVDYMKKYDSSDLARNSKYQRKGFKWNGLSFTIDNYNDLVKKQEGKCAICENTYIGKSNIGEDKQNFIVDHDHITGEVRGLLCNGCNRSIGYLNHENLLRKAIEYLQKIESK